MDGATVYSTRQSCRECSKNMLDAGVSRVFYDDPLLPTKPGELEAFLTLQAAFPGGVHQQIGAVTLPSMVPTIEDRMEVHLN